jgi:hypothetical protein
MPRMKRGMTAERLYAVAHTGSAAAAGYAAKSARADLGPYRHANPKLSATCCKRVSRVHRSAPAVRRTEASRWAST